MSSIFACDLGLNRKTLSRNFFCCFVFRFREIFFNQHWRQMRASLILLFGKTKAFFGKDTARKKTAFLHTLFVENERETSKLKWGAMFFYKVEGHMPKLSSFGRGKKFRPKKSLTSLLHAALQFLLYSVFVMNSSPPLTVNQKSANSWQCRSIALGIMHMTSAQHYYGPADK